MRASVTVRLQTGSESGVRRRSLSRVRLFVTPWTVAHQAPLSMGFSRQEYWSGLPFPSPGHLPDPGIEPGCPALQRILYHLSQQGSRRLQSTGQLSRTGSKHSPAGILLGFRTPAGNSQWLTKSQSGARIWRGPWPGWGVSSAWGPRDRSLWRVDVPPGRAAPAWPPSAGPSQTPLQVRCLRQQDRKRWHRRSGNLHVIQDLMLSASDTQQ